MRTSSKNTSKARGLSLERRRGQSITIPEAGLVIHIMKVYAGKVQLVFENTGETQAKVMRTELLGPSPL